MQLSINDSKSYNNQWKKYNDEKIHFFAIALNLAKYDSHMI